MDVFFFWWVTVLVYVILSFFSIIASILKCFTFKEYENEFISDIILKLNFNNNNYKKYNTNIWKYKKNINKIYLEIINKININDTECLLINIQEYQKYYSFSTGSNPPS